MPATQEGYLPEWPPRGTSSSSRIPHKSVVFSVDSGSKGSFPFLPHYRLVYRFQYMADSNVEGYQFLITDGAKEDMGGCADEDAYAAAYIATFLQELRGNPAYLERMIDEKYHDDKIEDICGVWSLQDKRINAYRTKFIEIKRWRLIFIVDRPSVRIGLFSIMHRDDDYETNKELWNDIEREFDALGFTRY